MPEAVVLPGEELLPVDFAGIVITIYKMILWIAAYEMIAIHEMIL
jgi:hypothetical protein